MFRADRDADPRRPFHFSMVVKATLLDPQRAACEIQPVLAQVDPERARQITWALAEF
jgi:hypothetical protein